MSVELGLELGEAGTSNRHTSFAAEEQDEEEETVQLVGADEAAGRHERRIRVVSLVLSVLVFCSLLSLLAVSLAQRDSVYRFNQDYSVMTWLMFSLSSFAETVKVGFLSVQMHASPTWYDPTVLNAWTESYSSTSKVLAYNVRRTVTELYHADAHFDDALTRQVHTAVNSTTMLQPVFARAFDLLESGDAEGATKLVQSSVVSSGLLRVYQQVASASQAVFDVSSNRQSKGVDRLRVVMAVCVSFAALLLVACVCVGCMLRKQLRLNTHVTQLLHKSEERCVQEYSRSSHSESADSDSHYHTPESDSRRTFRAARLLMKVFVALFLVLTLSAYCLVAVAMSRGADSFGDSKQLSLLRSWQQLPSSMGLYSIYAYIVTFSGQPLPALDWIPRAQQSLFHATRLLETVSCGALNLDSASILECGTSQATTTPSATPTETPDFSATYSPEDFAEWEDLWTVNDCVMDDFTAELRTQSEILLQSMIDKLSVEFYAVSLTAGTVFNNTWLRSDPDVVAVYGSPTPGTESDSVRCYSCADQWKRDPKLCTDKFLQHVWWVNDSRSTEDNELYAGSLVHTELDSYTTTADLLGQSRTALTEKYALGLLASINAQLSEFVTALHTEQAKETQLVKDWTWVAVWAITGSLVGIIVSWAVLLVQDRRRRKVQLYVRQEQEWSLNRILSYQPTAALFRQFAKKSFTEENVDFWQQAQACKRHRWPVSDALVLYEEFIREGAPQEINIPSTHRHAIAKFMDPVLADATAETHLLRSAQKLEQQQVKAMQMAQKNIWDLIAVNLYLQFLRDDDFQAYLQQRHQLYEKKFNILQRRSGSNLS